MALRWRAPLAVAAVLLAAACAAPGGTADSGGSGSGGTSVAGSNATGGASTAIVPFSEFLAGITSATYQQYAGEPGAKVRDAAAFGQMRAYLLNRYRQAEVTRTFADADGGVFDCIAQAGTTGPVGTCPAGSIPTRRVTLDDLVRYPSLQQFFSKGPDGTGGLPPLPSGTATPSDTAS